jgi:hypothetical protein
MALQRVWLVESESKRFVAHYKYDTGSFGLVYTDEISEAISVVTDHIDMDEIKMRLFQAVLRHPAPDSKLITFLDAISAYELVRRTCAVLSHPVDGDDYCAPSITYIVDSAHCEFDAFGAEQEIAKYDNRFVKLNGDIAQRRFRVLDARACVDAESGQWYPGITVDAGPEAYFWALPDIYLSWVRAKHDAGEFPLDVVFSEDEDGRPAVAVRKVAAADN